MAPLLELFAQFGPVLSIDSSELARRGRVQPRGGRRDEARRAAQHRRRRRHLAARGAPLVIAVRAEEVFEVVVGARYVGHRIAVEEARAPAARDLAEVPDGALERARVGGVAAHRGEHPVEAAPHEASRCLVLVAECVGGGMHPGIGALHIGPQRGRALQGSIEQTL